MKDPFRPGTGKATTIFETVVAKLKAIYGKPLPFILIYVHDNAEMLTNIGDKESREKLIDNAFKRIKGEPPQDI